MISSKDRSPRLRRYHRMAQEFAAMGLTSRGNPRRRRAKLTPEERRQYNTAKFRLRSVRLFELGLTTRGTKRKIRVGRASVLGEFRARLANAVLASERSRTAAHARVAQLLHLTFRPGNQKTNSFDGLGVADSPACCRVTGPGNF